MPASLTASGWITEARKGRKGNRRKGGRHKGNKAGISARHAKKGKGRIKRGPRARIAI